MRKETEEATPSFLSSSIEEVSSSVYDDYDVMLRSLEEAPAYSCDILSEQGPFTC